jgi:Sec-independent protein translocase protein TatA
MIAQIPNYEALVVAIFTGLFSILIIIIVVLGRYMFTTAVKSLTSYLEEFKKALANINEKLQEMNIELKSTTQTTDVLKDKIREIESSCKICKNDVQKTLSDLQHQINELH